MSSELAWAPMDWQQELAKKYKLTCGRGWYGFACKSGWKDIISAAFRLLKEYCEWDGEIHQIKEKFGTLRLYVSNVPEKHVALADCIIGYYEEQASFTCEYCGRSGSLRASKCARGAHSWWLTLCDACDADWHATRAAEVTK